jgi:phage pi2 protein 07
MLFDYNRKRAELLNQFMKGGIVIAEGKPWILEPSQLRFCLGESISELKIPYCMGAEEETITKNSILSLAVLLKQRLEPFTGQDMKKETISADKIELKAQLMEKTYRTDIFISGSIEKRLVTEMILYIPYLDSSILRNWLILDGYGMAYFKMVMKIFGKAAMEEVKCKTGEKTLYLALLAVVNVMKRERELLKRFDIKGVTYERLELTVGLAHFFILKEAISEAIVKQTKAGMTCVGRDSELLIESLPVPGITVNIPTGMLSTAINLYGINREAVNILSAIYKVVYTKAEDVSSLQDLIIKKVARESAVLNNLINISRLVKAREAIMDYLMDYDNPAISLNRELQDICQNEKLLRNVIGDPRKASRLKKSLEDSKHKYERDTKRKEKIEAIKRCLPAARRALVLGWLGGKQHKGIDEMLHSIVEGFLAYRFDADIERFVDLMRVVLVDRREEFSKEVLKSEYDRGRLYRFSSDKTPIIKALELEEKGYLFVDMKDFSRKTFKVKEIAMADFMKVNFYVPILESARRYRRGSGLLEDTKGIQLDNVVGDAAIFSGGVASLVALARDVQNISARYREELKKRLPPLRDQRILGKIHENYGRMKEDLEREQEEAEKALSGAEKGAKAKLIGLKEKESRLERNYREELEKAIKTEIESGLIITYGKKAEHIIIKEKKDFFKEVNIAIGEKINEAARGTYRNSVVWAKLEMALESERKERNKPELRYPFDVYIDRTYSIRMTPEMDSAIEELMAHRDVEMIKALANLVSGEYYSDLKKIASGAPISSAKLLTSMTDIYNKGQALSDEALKAYVTETRGVKNFFQRMVNIIELHEDIRYTFFLPVDPLELRFGVEVKDGVEMVEIFYRVGEVTFKGFEEAPPTVVHEILNREGDFFKMIMKYHFREWYDAVRDNKNSPFFFN